MATAFPSGEWQALAARVERLERQNRLLWRTVAFGSVLAAGCVLLLGYAARRNANPRFKTVQAEEFIVRDAGGRQRASFGLAAGESDSAPGMRLLSTRRVQEAGAAVGLVLYDESGEEQAHLSATALGGFFEIYGEGDAVLEAGGDVLSVTGGDGTVLELGAASGAYIEMLDAAGEVLWQAPPAAPAPAPAPKAPKR